MALDKFPVPTRRAAGRPRVLDPHLHVTDFTAQRALDVAARVVDAPMAAMVRQAGRPDRQVVLHASCRLGALSGRGDDPAQERIVDLTPGTEHDLDPRTARAYAATLPEILLTDRSLSVPVPVESREWHRLVVADVAPRVFSEADIELVVGVADVLASVLQRERAELAHGAVADFSRFALESRDIAATTERAMDVVTDVLEAPMASVIRRLPGPGGFQLVCGRGPLGLPVGARCEVGPEPDLPHATAKPLVVPDWRTEARFPRIPVSRAAHVLASLSVDLLVDGRPWGRLQALYPEPRRFDATDMDVIQSVAHTLAAALERDAIETRLRETAQTLQRALLPAQLPAVPGIETAARYIPAQGDRIGGDWYDVLALPHGAVGLVMGDVEGHDITAAAVMGQVRNVVRAYAADGHPPSEVMNRTNRFLAQHTDRLATCCFIELHPSELTATAVSAGHPRPLVLTGNGQFQKLPLDPGPPLGLDESTHYPEHTWLLPAGATLLLVTDGLVGWGGSEVHPGMRAFATAAARLIGHHVEVLADALVDRPPGSGEQRDDAALLVVRLADGLGPGLGGPDQARRVFRPAPESAPASRRFVRDILTGWGLGPLEDSALLAVSELVTNAVVHTTSPVRVTLRRLGESGLWIGVHDESDRFVRPHRATPDDISGRGLAIVESLADRWGVNLSPGDSGKTVWLELS